MLWIALLAPALAWFGQLMLSYSIAAYACANDQVWILHVITLAALVLAGAGLWSGWKSVRIQHRHSNEADPASTFLPWGALLLGLLFFLTIIASELSNLLLEPCT